ncbi:MAG: RNA methyltransferase [Candidatus Omnitrophota bacterium]|nr:RNA methyltransferase [Candidatus Omnitrophota bacterium]
MRKLSHIELLQRQADQKRFPLPFSIVLNDIRSLYNVGSIFRTADGIGIAKIWLCGITGCPPDTQISKTALGAENTVAWKYQRYAMDALRLEKEQGAEIVLLEQLAESIPYHEFRPRRPVCLVLGNEITGVSEELLELCDRAVEIPMAGLKNSLNVTVAFGIVAYHFRNSLAAGMSSEAVQAS